MVIDGDAMVRRLSSLDVIDTLNLTRSTTERRHCRQDGRVAADQMTGSRLRPKASMYHSSSRSI